MCSHCKAPPEQQEKKTFVTWIPVAAPCPFSRVASVGAWSTSIGSSFSILWENIETHSQSAPNITLKGPQSLDNQACRCYGAEFTVSMWNWCLDWLPSVSFSPQIYLTPLSLYEFYLESFISQSVFFGLQLGHRVALVWVQKEYVK